MDATVQIMGANTIAMSRVRGGTGLLFLASAFPKAGVEVSGIPVPLMMIPLVIGLLLLSTPQQAPWSIDVALLLLLVLSCIVATRVAFASSGLKEPIALLGWLMLPLAIVAITVVRRVDGRRVVTALLGGVRLAVAFGYLQLFFGVKQVAVPGITQTVGTDLDDKYLWIFVDGEVAFWKIPSTYQNGNNFGVVVAVCFAIALSHRKLYRSERFQLLDLTLFASAILLAGSRSVLLAWASAVAVLFVTPGILDRMTRIRLLVVLATAAVATVAFQPGLLDRFSFSSITDATGAGRTAAWGDLFSEMRLSEWVFGSVRWGGATDLSAVRDGVTEGWGGIVQQVGFVGLVLVLIVWLRYVWPVRAGLAVIAPLAVSMVLDSAYLAYPTLFLPAAFIAGLRLFDNSDGPLPALGSHGWVRYYPPRTSPRPFQIKRWRKAPD